MRGPVARARMQVEHQLDVLVNDLVALGSAAGSSGMSAATSRELADVLATLRYTLDYRIANGKLPHLSGLVCTRLLSALLTLTDDTVRIRWSSVTAAPQADEAVILIGGFAKSGAHADYAKLSAWMGWVMQARLLQVSQGPARHRSR